VLILEFWSNELFSVHLEWLSPMEKTSSLLVNHFYNGISTHVNDTNNIPICLGITYHKPFEIDICYIFSKQLHLISTKINIHYEKKRYFTIGLATYFFKCTGHLQFIIFKHHECQWINCMSYKTVIHHIYNATHCNFIKTTHFQLLCNSIIIAPMMSCWHH
jgi:hypothetical protein